MKTNLSNFNPGDIVWTYQVKSDDSVLFERLKIIKMSDRPLDRTLDTYVVELKNDQSNYATTTKWIFKTFNEASEAMIKKQERWV